MDKFRGFENQLRRCLSDSNDAVDCPDAETLAIVVDGGPIGPILQQHLVSCPRCRQVVAIASGPELMPNGSFPLALSRLTAQAQVLFEARAADRLEVAVSLENDNVVVLRNTGTLRYPTKTAINMRGPESVGYGVTLTKRFTDCEVELLLNFPTAGRLDFNIRATILNDEQQLHMLRCSVWRGDREIQSGYFRSAAQTFRALPLDSYRLLLDHRRQFMGEIDFKLHRS